MELTVLGVPGCPNEPILRERLARVLTDYPDVHIVRRTVHNEAEAARLGMHGSPTLLVDGADPFAEPDKPVGISCRIYRDETEHADGAPSVTALRRALAQARAPADRAGQDRPPPPDGG